MSNTTHLNSMETSQQRPGFYQINSMLLLHCVQVNSDKPPLGFINISAHHQHQLNENFAIDQKPASCHHHHGVKALKNSLKKV